MNYARLHNETKEKKLKIKMARIIKKIKKNNEEHIVKECLKEKWKKEIKTDLRKEWIISRNMDTVRKE